MKNAKIKQLLQAFVLMLALVIVSFTHISPVAAGTTAADSANTTRISAQNNRIPRPRPHPPTPIPHPNPTEVSWNG
ncbi:MAG: hypothetical protein KIH69_010710 [Anaerolineae bacterium]|nr:hypothetical protein [Anaerolineae bacterium]